MSYRFSAEIWVSDREAFIFRYRAPEPGKLWTFCVPRSTLENLNPNCSSLEAFEQCRADIYKAALDRIQEDNSEEQHTLSADDIRHSV